MNTELQFVARSARHFLAEYDANLENPQRDAHFVLGQAMYYVQRLIELAEVDQAEHLAAS